MMYIQIAKDKDMHYSHDRVKQLDKKRFDELRIGLGRCENDQFFCIEDEFYIYLKIKGGTNEIF